MPKFSTVQAYSDNNSNVQTVSYQQATGSSDGKAERVKTDKVVNAYGSTAGANSGEFHVYRQARARELGRMEGLKSEEEERLQEKEYRLKALENQEKDEERTAKRRKKRQRQKEAKRRRHNLEKAGINLGPQEGEGTEHGDDDDDDDDDEFAVPAPHKEDKPVEFANDGSFLEMMKQQMTKQAPKGDIVAEVEATDF
mmetsp:Transcript_5225/g.6831  ORF Transcript_5225/g.6831 Transcript_5225/m.6831 type:complete len:197 (+) Transcript_5225:84-674(+)